MSWKDDEQRWNLKVINIEKAKKRHLEIAEKLQHLNPNIWRYCKNRDEKLAKYDTVQYKDGLKVFEDKPNYNKKIKSLIDLRAIDIRKKILLDWFIVE